MSKLGDIYRKAARLVEKNKNEYSCNAVDWAANGYRTNARTVFSYMLNPRTRGESDDDFLYTTDFHPTPQTDETLPAARNHRVVALCLMAAMADAGDL